MKILKRPLWKCRKWYYLRKYNKYYSMLINWRIFYYSTNQLHIEHFEEMKEKCSYYYNKLVECYNHLH